VSWVYDDQTCDCFGGVGGGMRGGGDPTWSCETTPECPAAPTDGESCEGMNGMTCGECDCQGGFGGGGDPEWDCGGGPDFGGDGGAPMFPGQPEGDAGVAPGDPDNAEECPATTPQDGDECTGGGMGGGMGGGALQCTYGDETTQCVCGGFGGGGGMQGGGTTWNCQSVEPELECPAEPVDGESCEGYQGQNCGDCFCGGFGGGDPAWNCGGGGPAETDGGAFGGGMFGGN
jgi:hypothetical protein